MALKFSKDSAGYFTSPADLGWDCNKTWPDTLEVPPGLHQPSPPPGTYKKASILKDAGEPIGRYYVKAKTSILVLGDVI